MTRIKSLQQPEFGYGHRIHRRKRKVYLSPAAREQKIIRKKKLEKLQLDEII